MDLIRTAINNHVEEKIMSRWLIGGYEQVMSYKEFKSKLNEGIKENCNINDTKTEAEILEDVKNILNCRSGGVMV